MIPTTFPYWSTLVLIAGAVTLFEGLRFLGFYQLRREDHRLRFAGWLAITAGLYTVGAAVTYAQPSPATARPWVLGRYVLAALLPYTFIATIEALHGGGNRRVRRGVLAGGLTLIAGAAINHTWLLSYNARIRELPLIQTTFFEYEPRPLALAILALAAFALLYVIRLLWLRRAERRSWSALALIVAFSVTAFLDMLTILSITNLPYLLEFGFLALITAINRSLLIEYFDLLREKERLGAMRGRLLNSLSHELRTPLGVGLGYLELLERQEGRLEPTAAATIKRARTALLDEAVLIDELIEAVRFAGDAPSLALSDTDVAALAAAQVRLLEAGASRRDIRLFTAGETRAEASVDPHWMGLAIRALITNAVKYSPPNSTVTVRVSNEADGAVLEVIDQGPGISPDEAARIFEPFVQGRDVERSELHTGLGLGLKLVRDVVEAHGGSIAIDSRCATGATFSIRLPRLQPQL